MQLLVQKTNSYDSDTLLIKFQKHFTTGYIFSVLCSVFVKHPMILQLNCLITHLLIKGQHLGMNSFQMIFYNYSPDECLRKKTFFLIYKCIMYCIDYSSQSLNFRLMISKLKEFPTINLIGIIIEEWMIRKKCCNAILSIDDIIRNKCFCACIEGFIQELNEIYSIPIYIIKTFNHHVLT